MEPYEQQRYDDYYAMPPPQHPPPRSRSVPRYTHERPPPPPIAHDPNNYYNYGPPPLPPPHPSNVQGQYYDENEMHPPPLPHKIKKKSMLKSPLTAIKNALIKTTKPLRRMNSMGESDRKVKSGLRRQHSMLERGMQRPYYPDEYPTYPAGFDDRYYGGRGRSVPASAMRGRSSSTDQYYEQQNYGHYPPQQQDVMNSTYQNLETEDIYGHMGTVPRSGRERSYNEFNNGYADHDDLYANRACIDLERRQAEATSGGQGRSGRKIIRRHSTTTADRSAGRRHQMPPNGAQGPYDPDDVYQSKQGAYMLDNQRRAPNSEVMTRRRFYPGAANEQVEIHEPIYQSRREMQRERQNHHLYQTKKEMQERITQGKRDIEREFTPPQQNQMEKDDKTDKEPIYQSRREIKESALKTRAQLRDQIYQTRREALDSMAEPGYVSKRDVGRPEPIYESKEESILQSRENETDEKKEEKTEIQTQAEINHHEVAGGGVGEEEETLSRSELQKSSDTVIENTQSKSKSPRKSAPLVQSEDDDLDVDTAKDFDRSEMPTVIENRHNQGMLEETQNNANETQDISDDVFETPQAVSSPLVIEGPPIEPLEPPKPTLPLTPRTSRAPFHISNILKRTGPPPLKKLSESRTSIETQYTSQASLPVGPPNATSTPYTSNMSLPIAGPVPTSAPAAASAPGNGSFPTMPREPSTCRGIFDSTGGTLADNIWNVSLQIPPGAIAPGVRQEIYFTVSDPRMGQAVGGPPLDMENGLFYFPCS